MDSELLYDDIRIYPTRHKEGEEGDYRVGSKVENGGLSQIGLFRRARVLPLRTLYGVLRLFFFLPYFTHL